MRAFNVMTPPRDFPFLPCVLSKTSLCWLINRWLLFLGGAQVGPQSKEALLGPQGRWGSPGWLPPWGWSGPWWSSPSPSAWKLHNPLISFRLIKACKVIPGRKKKLEGKQTPLVLAQDSSPKGRGKITPSTRSLPVPPLRKWGCRWGKSGPSSSIAGLHGFDSERLFTQTVSREKQKRSEWRASKKKKIEV